MDIVTGYRGEPHITANQTGTFNAGIVGTANYVMPTGEQLAASIISNNLIRILDGDIVMQGRHITIAKGTYEEVEISNGLQGMKRNDLICVRYTKDINTNIENAEIVVVQGVSTENNPSDPTYNTDSILSGAIISDMPLYRIKLDGLVVGEPEKLFKVTKNIEDIMGIINELNTNITGKFETSKIFTVQGLLNSNAAAVTFNLPKNYSTPPYLISAQIQLNNGVWTDMRTLEGFTHIRNDISQVRIDRTSATYYADYFVRFLFIAL